MAWRGADLSTGQDLWEGPSPVTAFLELVLSFLLLVTCIFSFLTVSFGQTFKLQLPPSFRGSRRSERAAGEHAAEFGKLTLLCQDHAKQISLLRSSFFHITTRKSGLCEVCALLSLFCSCSESSHAAEGFDMSLTLQPASGPESRRLEPGSVELKEDELNSKPSALQSRRSAVTQYASLSICPRCNLAVMAASPHEVRSVKRKLESGWFSDDASELAGLEDCTVDNLSCRDPVGRDDEDPSTGPAKADAFMADGARQLPSHCAWPHPGYDHGGVSLWRDVSTQARLAELEAEGRFGTARYCVASERNALAALHMELEKERSASATAASEAMAMIARLQEEKALIQMEARQYQRMAEEKSAHDQEAISLLKDILMRREEDLLALEKELNIYRRRVLAGIRASERGSSSDDVSAATGGLPSKVNDIALSELDSKSGLSVVGAIYGPQHLSEYAEESDLGPGVGELLDEEGAKHCKPFDLCDYEMLNFGRKSLNDMSHFVQPQGLPGSLVQEHSRAVQPQVGDNSMQELGFDGVDPTPSFSRTGGESSESGVTNFGRMAGWSVEENDLILDQQEQAASVVVENEARMLDAMESSVPLLTPEGSSYLREESASPAGAVDTPDAHNVFSDAATDLARSIVLEENRLSVQDYVRKFEGQLGRKQVSPPARRSPVVGGSRVSQKGQTVGDDEERDTVDQERTAVPKGSPNTAVKEYLETSQSYVVSKASVAQSREPAIGIASADMEMYKEQKSCFGQQLQPGSSNGTGCMVDSKIENRNLSLDADELRNRYLDGAESPVLDVYEVSSGYGTDQRSRAPRPRSPSSAASGSKRSGSSKHHEASNRLGKPDAHPYVSDHGKGKMAANRRETAMRNFDQLDTERIRTGYDAVTSYAPEVPFEAVPHAEGHRGSMDQNERHTTTAVSGDRYRMMMEEEALCLISRLESVEADRQAMKQTIDSLRRENGEMKVLQEIAQRLRELRSLEKKGLNPPDSWQREEPSATSTWKGVFSFTRLRCSVQAHLNKFAHRFLKSADTGAKLGQPVGLRLLQSSPQPPVAMCITRGVKADALLKADSSLASLLLPELPSGPVDGWVVDAKGRHGTALGGWYY